MWRLLGKFSLILVLVVIINLALAWVSAYAIDGVEQRFDRLENAEEPRIVFVGGSNNIYGIWSAGLQERLEPYQVVNMGFVAPIGAGVMLSQIEPYLKPGDTVVLSLEYQHFHGLFFGRDVYLRRFVSLRPQTLQHVSHWRQWQTILEGHSRQTRNDLRDLFRRWRTLPPDRFQIRSCDGLCVRERYDELSDIKFEAQSVARLKLEPEEINYSTSADDFDAESLNRINAFGKRMTARGVDVYIVFPPTPIDYADKMPFIDATYERLQTDIDGEVITILGEPKDYMLPIEQFWNTQYHVSPEGRAERTRVLSEKLSLVLPLISEE